MIVDITFHSWTKLIEGYKATDHQVCKAGTLALACESPAASQTCMRTWLLPAEGPLVCPPHPRRSAPGTHGTHHILPNDSSPEWRLPRAPSADIQNANMTRKNEHVFFLFAKGKVMFLYSSWKGGPEYNMKFNWGYCDKPCRPSLLLLWEFCPCALPACSPSSSSQDACRKAWSDWHEKKRAIKGQLI